MKSWKLGIGLFLWTALLSLWGLSAQGAGFAPSLSLEEGGPGSVVEVVIPYDGSLGDVAAFRTSVSYDPQVFEYLRPQYTEGIREGTITTREDPGLVSSVFTADAEGPYPTEGDGITYRFSVREDAPPGEYSFFASVFELASPDPEPLGGDVDASLSFSVPQPPSSDARLLSLVADHGFLTPAFSPDCYSYSMTVPYEVESIIFTAQPVPGAICRVNRKNLGSGGSDTPFTITVTAEDGETKSIYTVTVHRQEKEEEPEEDLSSDARLLSLVPSAGTLTPAFDPDVHSYSISVPYEVTTMTFTGQAAEGATFRVNRKNLGSGGSDTPFTITVTAEDEETKSVYTVTVHRQEKEEEPEEDLSSDARLLSLVPSAGTLTPAFDSAIYSYSISVPYEVTTMTFTGQASEGATFRVNRKNLGSGGSDTPFTITVTAEDGETKSIYTVTVHRQEKEEEPEEDLSSDARLLSLVPSAGTLTPAFDSAIYSYSISVPYEVTTMSFTGQASEGATFRVNRKNLGSGGSDTPFTITVTAEDEETKSVYTVTVHRQEKSSTTGTTAVTSTSSRPTGGGTSGGKNSGSTSTQETSPEDTSSSQEEVPVLEDMDSIYSSSEEGTSQTVIPAEEESASVEEENAGSLVFQNGTQSLLPATLVMLLFILFCFLSGPLAKFLAKRFPKAEENPSVPEEKP